MATFKVHVPAGPIFSNDEAKIKGPFVAAAHGGRYTGGWLTVVDNVMSVVEIELPAPAGKGSVEFTLDMPAGPLNDNEDAKAKAPAIAASYNAQWNGQWKTIVTGKMSVIGCKFSW